MLPNAPPFLPAGILGVAVPVRDNLQKRMPLT